MRIVSKTQTKTTLLALLTCLIFSACSQLEPKSSRTGSVSFNLNAAREVTSDAGTLVDIELRGDYEDSLTVTLSADKKASVTFEDVPVGKNVSVYVQVYTPYDGAKSVTYFGESESKKITSGNNDFTVPLATAYNSIAKGNSSCLILNPLFTSEATNKTLNSTTLNFTENSETFSYKINQLIQEENLSLDDYQKAVIYIKSNSTGDHFIRPKLVKSTTAAMYYLSDDDGVLVPEEPLEMDIMQGINIDSIGFENSWDGSNWAADQSITIEKIELFKDTSMIDNEFNVVTKTDTVYIVENPALQKVVKYMEIEKNKITFTPGIAQANESDHNNFNAAYWEFEDLKNYDKVTIKFRGTENMYFLVNGYRPCDYSKNIQQMDSADDDNYENQISINSPDGQEKEFSITLLTKNFDLNNLKAIEFKNDTYNNGNDSWTLEIKQIKLEKTGSSEPSYNVLNDILGQISNLTSSGTVKAIQAGEIDADGLVAIADALDDLASNSPDVEVTLDLSNITGITSIKDYEYSEPGRFKLFQTNINLVEITLPASFNDLNDLFDSCLKLKKVLFQGPITVNMANGIFRGCSALEEISDSFGSNYYLQNNAIYTNSNGKISLLEYYAKASEENPVFVDGVSIIGADAFNSCSIKSVTIPDTVTLFNGSSNFNNCTKLETVVLPANTSFTTIPMNAFSNCSALTTITIPSSVRTISSYAFSSCSSITTVNYLGTEQDRNTNLNIDSSGNTSLTSNSVAWIYQS